jgi:hypothetical protein
MIVCLGTVAVDLREKRLQVSTRVEENRQQRDAHSAVGEVVNEVVPSSSRAKRSKVSRKGGDEGHRRREKGSRHDVSCLRPKTSGRENIEEQSRCFPLGYALDEKGREGAGEGKVDNDDAFLQSRNAYGSVRWRRRGVLLLFYGLLEVLRLNGRGGKRRRRSGVLLLDLRDGRSGNGGRDVVLWLLLVRGRRSGLVGEGNGNARRREEFACDRTRKKKVSFRKERKKAGTHVEAPARTERDAQR